MILLDKNVKNLLFWRFSLDYCYLFSISQESCSIIYEFFTNITFWDLFQKRWKKEQKD